MSVCCSNGSHTGSMGGGYGVWEHLGSFLGVNHALHLLPRSVEHNIRDKKGEEACSNHRDVPHFSAFAEEGFKEEHGDPDARK